MIELKNDSLVASFPDVHPSARLTIDFQRTLRIPDDGEDYALPPGLGRFPLSLVDDFALRMPSDWLQRGGVLLPMYQSEAMWLNFSPAWVEDRDTGYPFAIKVAAGKINAVTGDNWSETLRRNPQDYLVAPTQPWLDGFAVEKGIIRQFVAMPLGSGYSAEEQLTGQAEFGGLQLLIVPMKREVFERRFPKRERRIGGVGEGGILYAAAPMIQEAAAPDMSLAPGGRMHQEIYDDEFDFDDWDREHTSRCFVHLTNSLVWQAITGTRPPTVPPTAKQYTRAGLPWFEYYDEGATAVEGSTVLAKLKSVLEMGKAKGDAPLPENESVTPDNVVKIRKGLKEGQVREGTI